ncbi:MAG: hypothetical protein IJ867_07115, partial [Clostridia bacterium]|nr:hypothetical protein [Clostridia bacterium]
MATIGIITNAQNANMQNGLAALQEYIQELYVEHYDNLSSDKTPLKGLMEVSSSFNSYFYSSRNDFEMGDYLFDSEGNVIYVLKISALPKEIREQLIGGTAEGYATIYDADTSDDAARDNLYYECFNKLDIYGVTSDLKVYYCYADGTMLGDITLDKANDSEGAINTTSADYASVTKILTDGGYDNNGDGAISVAEIRAVETLQLTNAQLNSLSNFSDFYAMTNLKSLYINYSGSTRKE